MSTLQPSSGLTATSSNISTNSVLSVLYRLYRFGLDKLLEEYLEISFNLKKKYHRIFTF